MRHQSSILFCCHSFHSANHRKFLEIIHNISILKYLNLCWQITRKQSICVQKPTSFCVLDVFATEYLWDIFTWMLTAQTTHKYSITGICQSRLITRNYSQTSTNYFTVVKGAERIVITGSVHLEVFLIYFSAFMVVFVFCFIFYRAWILVNALLFFF